MNSDSERAGCGWPAYAFQARGVRWKVHTAPTAAGLNLILLIDLTANYFGVSIRVNICMKRVGS